MGMVFQLSRTVSADESHSDDVECCLVLQDHLYTGADDGSIKVWTLELELVHSWSAHSYVVYDLAADPDTSTLYSCSMDGEIKRWSVISPRSPQCLATAIQTGPTGAGADLGGMGGGAASLEHEPVTVRSTIYINKAKCPPSLVL